MRTRIQVVLSAVVVIAFLLPWFTVSCSGRPIAAPTGLELVTGNVDLSAVESMSSVIAGAAGIASRASDHLDLWRVWGAGVLMLASACLLLALLGRRAPTRWIGRLAGAQVLMLVGGALLAPMSLGRLAESAASKSAEVLGFAAEGAMGGHVANSVGLQPAAGYWIALVASAMVPLLSLRRRRASQQPQAAAAQAPTEPRPTRVRALAPAPAISTRSPTSTTGPGLFGTGVEAVVSRHQGSTWRERHRVSVPEGRSDLGQVDASLSGVWVGSAQGRVWIEAPWPPPLLLYRSGRPTVIDATPPRLIVWPGDEVVAGEWRFTFMDQSA